MRPFSGLSEGKEWFSNLLLSRGYSVRETGQYAHWDLEAVSSKGRKYIFELKNRSFCSSKYGDAAFNYDKYIHLKDTPDDVTAIFVSFWLDGWAMIDIKKTVPDVFSNRAARTTRFQDKTIIDKKWASWNLEHIRILSY